MEIDQVFTTDWQQASQSLPMRQALQYWRTHCGGLIDFDDVQDLVITLSSGGPSSRPASQYLLKIASDDMMARRVLFQAMQPIIKTQVAKYRDSSPYTQGEWFTMCVTAGWIAVGQLAGQNNAWAMWELRKILVRELIDMQNLQSAPNAPSALLAHEHATEPKVDSVIELGRVLIKAAKDGLISSDDAALVWSTRTGYCTVAHLARKAHVPARSVQERRSVIENRLIHWAAA